MCLSFSWFNLFVEFTGVSRVSPQIFSRKPVGFPDDLHLPDKQASGRENGLGAISS